MSTREIGTQTEPVRFQEDEGFELVGAQPARTYGISDERLHRALIAGYRARDFLDGKISTLPTTEAIELKDRHHVLIRGRDSCGHSGVTTSLKVLRTHTNSNSVSHSFASLTECRIYWSTVQGCRLSDNIPPLVDSCPTTGSNGQ